MPLSDADREHVITTALDLLRHERRERLLEILRDRLARGDYADEDEQSLDEIACAIATAIDEQLRE